MNRICGACTLCCRLLPMKEIDKRAGDRCPAQRVGRGCAIYARRPGPCRLWSCRWLTGDGTAELHRPDRSHYVIDLMPDFVTAVDNATGERRTIPVVQIWVDPKYPDAHREPALRAYLAELAATKGYAAQIRFDSYSGLTIFAPAMSSDGEWHEITGTREDREHTTDEVFDALRGPTDS